MVRGIERRTGIDLRACLRAFTACIAALGLISGAIAQVAKPDAEPLAAGTAAPEVDAAKFDDLYADVFKSIRNVNFPAVTHAVTNASALTSRANNMAGPKQKANKVAPSADAAAQAMANADSALAQVVNALVSADKVVTKLIDLIKKEKEKDGISDARKAFLDAQAKRADALAASVHETLSQWTLLYAAWHDNTEHWQGAGKALASADKEDVSARGGQGTQTGVTVTNVGVVLFPGLGLILWNLNTTANGISAPPVPVSP